VSKNTPPESSSSIFLTTIWLVYRTNRSKVSSPEQHCAFKPLLGDFFGDEPTWGSSI
jgi:hypothetical protein